MKICSRKGSRVNVLKSFNEKHQVIYKLGICLWIFVIWGYSGHLMRRVCFKEAYSESRELQNK